MNLEQYIKGDVAQTGERVLCKHQVRSSILLISTKDVLVMQMNHDTPAGVPVYLDYGKKYYAGREDEVIAPTDA